MTGVDAGSVSDGVIFGRDLHWMSGNTVCGKEMTRRMGRARLGPPNAQPPSQPQRIEGAIDGWWPANGPRPPVGLGEKRVDITPSESDQPRRVK